jgi:PKD repeat protein
MKKIFGAIAALSLLAPVMVNAQTASNADLQSRAQALLQEVATLQAQLAAQQGGTGTNSTISSSGGATTVSNAACPNIGRVLKLGSTGDDVTRLQQFLAGDSSVYPQGTVSGYYGALTQAAVQRWQVKFNIVSSGTAATTGYGVVGPRTAAAIALTCSTGASAPVGGYIQVTPISGNAPLNVNVNATVNSTNSCAGAIYQLSWGDGSNPISIPVSANNCQPMSQNYQHTYSTGGTYQVILSSGAHQTSATVTVYGTTSMNTGGTATFPQETFSANPTSGSAPLTVSFSGIVTGADQGWCASGCSDVLVFGDGAQTSVPLPVSQTQAQNYTLQHSYTSGGNFTAVLYQGQSGNGRPIVGTPLTIAVTGGSGNISCPSGTSYQQVCPALSSGGNSNSCTWGCYSNQTPPQGGGSSYTYNTPSVTPLAGGNPLAVSITFDMPSCTNYQIDWHDSTAATSGTSQCGSATAPNITSQHTYPAAGTYDITLTRGSNSYTANIVVQ